MVHHQHYLFGPVQVAGEQSTVELVEERYGTSILDSVIKKSGLLYHILDIGINIVIIVAIVGVIRTFLVSPFQVEGSSMVSTLEDGEYIIINKLAYYIGDPERGDVVVFRPPTDPDKYYVKRVIGLPGDTVSVRDGFVYLKPSDGPEQKLDEEYLTDRNSGHTFRHPPTSDNREEVRYTVPEDTYFVMGDNRLGSLDSRSFMDKRGDPQPFVPISNIKGKVWVVALPISKIHALGAPQYGL